MSVFAEQVTNARRGLRGRRTDLRVRKASNYGQTGAKPEAQQIDQPAGLGNTPPATQAHNMYEGIDLTSPNFINDQFQRYGADFIHRDPIAKHSAKQLRKAAKHPDVHPRAKVLLQAAAEVRKAFSGGNPLPGGPAEFANTTPSVAIPARPKHGAPGNPDNTYPATVGARSHSAPTAAANPGAVTHEPQTAGQASRGGSTAEAVSRQWVYSPAAKNPVSMPMDKTPGGVGDDDREYNSSPNGRYLGQPQAGDLIHFNGPGGSKFQAKVTQLTTGAVIGEFAGQSCTFPLDSISPHNVGGSDHGPANKPAGLTASRPGPGVGVGAKNDSSEFKPQDGAGNSGTFGKSQTDAIYNGGQDMSAKTGAGAGITLKQPDAGTPVQPYNTTHPYSPEEGEQDGAQPGNPVNGSLTSRERALIERVISHRGPVATEVAALKALTSGTGDDRHTAVIVKALRAHAFAAPAIKADVNRITAKLLP